MRLHQIRLAGFKTFVDPAVIDLPTNRTALVGPNGAGKSNIIDAVRWVIGERSAKNLRGETLEDVIFKGSDARAPADLASIELIFDAVEGRVGRLTDGGSELSVRREVTRDGQSIYRLNGTRCRRRDVLDVFLDTGFTSQGYAIIEQGRISQLVQAKPEELRGYLEEAAGISRYKERRRETELSMEQAGLNLERARQLSHDREERVANLERQAKRANRYRKLAERQRTLEACEAAKRRQQADQELTRLAAQVLESDQNVSTCENRRRTMQSRRDALYAERDTANAQLNKASGEYFDAGAEISRAETALESLEQALTQHTQDLRAARSERASVLESLEKTRQLLDAAKLKLQHHSTSIGGQERTRKQDSEALQASTEALRNHRSALASATDETSRVRQQLARLEADIAGTRERIADAEHRVQQLSGDPETDDTAHLSELDAAVHEAERACDQLVAQKKQTQKERAELRAGLAPLEADIDAKRHIEQRLRRELSATLALAGDAGETDSQAIDQWLETCHAHKLPRLGGTVCVPEGWQAAARTLLSGKTAGVLAPSVEQLAAHLDGLTAGELLIVESDSRAASRASPLDEVLGVTLGSLFAGVRVAEQVADALAERGQLAAGESIICRDGTWVGPDWIRVNRRHLPESAFDRAPDVEALRAQCEAAETHVQTAQQALSDAREALEHVHGRLDQIAGELNLAESERGRAMTAHQVEAARLQEISQRRERVAATRKGLEARIKTMQDKLRAAEQERESMATRCAAQEAERARYAHLVANSEQQHETLRQAAQKSEADYQNLRVQHERLIVAEKSHREALPQLESRARALEQRLVQVGQRIEEAVRDKPQLEAERERWLQRRLATEDSLQTARHALETLETGIRSHAQTLADTETELESLRGIRENRRVAAGEARARVTEISSGIKRLQVDESDMEALLHSVKETSVDELVQQRLDVERSMARIGDVNLAASEDLRREQALFDEQQAQIQDIEASLETLTNALDKIDDDMVKRFRSTFERANQGLEELFPKLFGGGSAKLEMHGNRLLETGISFMANPPGKRNTSVTLLSGGEKAMSAVALIFSLFRLNPSPVCLLDEVDAPLDDENVERFVSLLREMSSEVQFVVVTHNKLTMEMADQLLGVTMREPGVSHLVSVDINQAASLANTE